MSQTSTVERTREVGQAYALEDAVKASPYRRITACFLDFVLVNWCIMAVSPLFGFLHGIKVAGFEIKIASAVVLGFLVLSRDFIFEGRGLGKNLVCLQSIDRKTGRPPSLAQSVKRNAVVMAPMVLWVILFSFREAVAAPTWAWITGALSAVLAITLSLELLLIFLAKNGLRLADKLAGTITIPSSTDFSNPFSLKSKSTNIERFVHSGSGN